MHIASGPLRYGFIMAVMFIAYFLIVRLFGLHENPWLRLFNGVILAGGLYASISHSRLAEGDKFSYPSGFRSGLLTGFVATVIFVFFMAVYMFHLDPVFPEKILDVWMKNYNQGPGILVFILAVEGLASTVVLTLAFMQKFKPSWNKKKG